MTNWEGWLRPRTRRGIICDVERYENNDECPKHKCILYPICSKPRQESYREECERFLDSDYKMEIDAVIVNLGKIREYAESEGYDGYVTILNRAIELLKGENNE